MPLRYQYLQVLESSVVRAKFELEFESVPGFLVFSLFSLLLLLLLLLTEAALLTVEFPLASTPPPPPSVVLPPFSSPPPFLLSLLEIGTHLKIFIDVSPIVTHFFSQRRTRSIESMNFLTSSFLLARVSALTLRDILGKGLSFEETPTIPRSRWQERVEAGAVCDRGKNRLPDGIHLPLQPGKPLTPQRNQSSTLYPRLGYNFYALSLALPLPIFVYFIFFHRSSNRRRKAQHKNGLREAFVSVFERVELVRRSSSKRWTTAEEMFHKKLRDEMFRRRLHICMNSQFHGVNL